MMVFVVLYMLFILMSIYDARTNIVVVQLALHRWCEFYRVDHLHFPSAFYPGTHFRLGGVGIRSYFYFLCSNLLRLGTHDHRMY